MVKFINFICGDKIKLWEKFSGICQVNPIESGESKFYFTIDAAAKMSKQPPIWVVPTLF